MSKIARIYQGTNEIQKYYQGGVLQRLFFDWKHYIGNELNIEYAKECAGGNVMISGKTYQNLFDMKNLNYNYYDTLTDDVYKNINIPELSTGYKVCKSAVNNLIKANTVYTMIIDVRKNTFNKNFGINSDYNNEGYFSKNIVIQQNFTGRMVVTATSKETLPSSGQKVFRTQITPDSLGEIEFKLMLLEGDYTNTDLPNSIDGIESVAEGEFVKSKNLLNPDNLEYGNINKDTGENLAVTNTMKRTIGYIKVSPKTQYIINTSCRVFEYDKDKSFLSSTAMAGRFITSENTEYIKLHGNTTKEFAEGKNLQLELGDTPTEYKPFYEYYPATIRNYNYKCETYGIVLPNGVKNSIETINGVKVHIQRVGKIVLDKSNASNFKQVNNMQVFRWEYFFEIKDFISGLCDKFPIKNVESLINENKGIRLSGTSFRGIDIKFPDNAGFNINTFKTWLSENPVTVWYELATPIYTYLESGIYDEITIPSGNIKNEIYSENGKWYHKRNIGKAIFDGSSDENWYYEATFKRFNSPDINDCIYKNGRTPVCIKGYTYSEKSGDNFDTLAFLSGAYNGCKLYIYNYAYTSVKDFRAYLAKNPLEVYYELAEPVISELYFSDITYKLNGPLRSLPNGVCDTIEENKLVQRVGKVVLDGNEDWIFQSCDTNGNGILNIYFIIQDLKLKEKQFIICDKYIQQNTAIANTTKEGVLVNDEKRLYLRLFTSKATTVEEAKEYIKDNPFVVYYELATPIETEITPDKIPPFLLKEGLTTLKSTNNITPQIELDCLVRDDFQNMCNNEWESGDIDLNTGVNKDSTDRIRLVNDIQVKSNTTYRIDITNLVQGKNIGLRCYDISKTYIRSGLIGNIKSSTYTFTTPEDCYYIRFIVETNDTNFKIYLKEVIN